MEEESSLSLSPQNILLFFEIKNEKQKLECESKKGLTSGRGGWHDPAPTNKLKQRHKTQKKRTGLKRQKNIGGEHFASKPRRRTMNTHKKTQAPTKARDMRRKVSPFVLCFYIPIPSHFLQCRLFRVSCFPLSGGGSKCKKEHTEKSKYRISTSPDLMIATLPPLSNLVTHRRLDVRRGSTSPHRGT